MFWKKRSVWIEVGFGEALDRLSTLKIKCEKFDGVKKVIVDQERKKLEKRLQKCRILFSSRSCSYGLPFRELYVEFLYNDLFAVNFRLWDIEDTIREICECDNCSEEELKNCVALARKVYKLNDTRSQLKKKIDTFLGSSVVEIKEYKE